MATTTGVTRSGNQLIDGQLSGVKWVGTLTYSDPSLASAYTYIYDSDGDGISVQNEGFSRLSAAQLAAVHAVMSGDANTTAGRSGFSIEGLTNLSTSYLSGGSGAGDVRFANSTDPGTAYAFYPNSNSYGGDVWFGQAGDLPVVGTYDYHAVMHEIGHALGLKHGHETGGFGALPAAYDSHEYSIMTYRSYPGSPGTFYSNGQFDGPQSFMMADIAALQYMYGADFTTNSGATTYSWTPGAGTTFVNGVASISPGGNRILLTIWDGGGQDTYDLSAYSTALNIDLSPGGYSTFSSVQRANLGGGYQAKGNVFNALQYQNDARSLIENAIGGSGADTIGGNAAANNLKGVGGADTLIGRGGADILVGGIAKDILVGGIANDIFRFEKTTDSFGASRDIIQGDATAIAFQGAGAAVGDKIDLSLIDANLSVGGNQAFLFGTLTTIGRCWAVNVGTSTYIRANVDGDAAIEFELAIADGATLANAYLASDFTL